jgi:hypothetical protein
MNTPQLDWLDQLDPVKLPEHEKIKGQWISTFSKIHRVDESHASTVFEKEALYWRKAVSASENLKSCTKLTLYSAFMELAVNGLSLQPGSKSECFLESRGAKAGKDGNGKDLWINLCYVRITAYGELNMRIMSGQIIRMKNPIVIYACDHFQPLTNQRGELIIDYKPAIPRTSTEIIGCWVCIELPGGSLDFKWLLEDDILRLKKYATTSNVSGTYTNALYTKENGGIDPGFLEAKTIKHAMRSYTKLRVGENVAMDDEVEELEATEVDAKEPFGNPIPKNENTVQFEINPNESF